MINLMRPSMVKHWLFHRYLFVHFEMTGSLFGKIVFNKTFLNLLLRQGY